MQLSERWMQHSKRPAVFWAVGMLLAGCSSSLPNSYEVNLADHLTESGAKMYGAYWCPHCATQKKYFGGAVSRIPYVECDAEGLNNESEHCEAMGITAYPTWVIEGDYYLGAQPLIKLERLSGFEGAMPNADDATSTGDVSPAK